MTAGKESISTSLRQLPIVECARCRSDLRFCVWMKSGNRIGSRMKKIGVLLSVGDKAKKEGEEGHNTKATNLRHCKFGIKCVMHALAAQK